MLESGSLIDPVLCAPGPTIKSQSACVLSLSGSGATPPGPSAVAREEVAVSGHLPPPPHTHWVLRPVGRERAVGGGWKDG